MMTRNKWRGSEVNKKRDKIEKAWELPVVFPSLETLQKIAR
jgi:hypothetical protein